MLHRMKIQKSIQYSKAINKGIYFVFNKLLKDSGKAECLKLNEWQCVEKFEWLKGKISHERAVPSVYRPEIPRLTCDIVTWRSRY